MIIFFCNLALSNRIFKNTIIGLVKYTFEKVFHLKWPTWLHPVFYINHTAIGFYCLRHFWIHTIDYKVSHRTGNCEQTKLFICKSFAKLKSCLSNTLRRNWNNEKPLFDLSGWDDNSHQSSENFVRRWWWDFYKRNRYLIIDLSGIG